MNPANPVMKAIQREDINIFLSKGIIFFQLNNYTQIRIAIKLFKTLKIN